jgi:hypothetical protein
MPAAGQHWCVSVLQSLVWAAGGALVWWPHWKHDGGQRLRGGVADVALIMAGVLAAGVLALGGAGVVLFVLLRLAFDRTDPLNELLAPLAPALAAAAIGGLVWAYHRISSGAAAPCPRGGHRRRCHRVAACRCRTPGPSPCRAVPGPAGRVPAGRVSEAGAGDREPRGQDRRGTAA